uniref:Uncharacterized protein n=1 Tax=Timema poppense TaxID=170557 RepID=A0A7R9DW31_TIMPO|nr:unnamed protein product [Timema poppensis]
MTSLVLTDSSQLTADSLEKLLGQIMYSYAEPDDLQKHVFSSCGSAARRRCGEKEVEGVEGWLRDASQCSLLFMQSRRESKREGYDVPVGGPSEDDGAARCG